MGTPSAAIRLILKEIRNLYGFWADNPVLKISCVMWTNDRPTASAGVFQPLSGYESRPENIYSTLLALLLIAHGANLRHRGHGAWKRTGHHRGYAVTHVGRWFLREETTESRPTRCSWITTTRFP